MICLAFLLVRVFRFVTVGHDASSLVDDQNERTLPQLVPQRGDPGTNISRPRSQFEDPISDQQNLV
jgi:hypothetical protein